MTTIFNASALAEIAAMAALAGLTIAILRRAPTIRFAPIRRRVSADRRQPTIEERFRSN